MIPAGHGFPAPPSPRTPAGTLLAILRVLLQETVFGILFWSSAAPGTGSALARSMFGLCTVILWTRRFGYLRPSNWTTASWEGLLVYVGAVCICNLLTFGFGVAPWWR